VEVTIWIDENTSLPRAVEACRTPVEPFQAIREVVTLDSYQAFGGVLLPTRIAHYVRAANGDRKLKFKIQLAEVELNPPVTRADFRPPPGLEKRFGK
jgi:hypothetical protein